MPRFTNTPPDDPAGYALPIVRTPAQGKFHAVVTSEDLIGTNTHWWGGRTVPCESPHCPACQEGVPFRWHAYCSVYNHKNGLHVLFECTAQASEALVQYRRAHGTLRGADIIAYRWRSTPNGRVLLRATPSQESLDSLPKPPNLIKVLSIIWQLKEDTFRPGESGPYGRDLLRKPIPDPLPAGPNSPAA